MPPELSSDDVANLLQKIGIAFKRHGKEDVYEGYFRGKVRTVIVPRNKRSIPIMAVMVVDEQKKPIRGPYVVRLGGWTLERYLKEAPEYLVWEFVRGEVVMHSSATAEHQDVVGFLYRLLAGYCEATGWGKVLTVPAAVQILPDVVREPDIFVLPPEEVPKAKGTPLGVRSALVVEVISPSTRTIDLKEKAEDYALAQIPEY